MVSKKILIVIVIITLILFSGCNSSYLDFKIDCKNNPIIQKEVLGYESIWVYDNGTWNPNHSQDMEIMENYCLNLYVNNLNQSDRTLNKENGIR